MLKIEKIKIAKAKIKLSGIKTISEAIRTNKLKRIDNLKLCS